MRKIFSLVTILLFPCIANAQTEVSDITIQKAAEALKPALCNNNLSKAIQIAQDCYQNIQDATINETNQCVIEDFTVNGLVQMKRKKAAAQGLPEPYAGNDFVNPDNLQVRLIKYRNSYAYENASSEVMHKKLYNDTMRVALALHQDNCFNPNLIH